MARSAPEQVDTLKPLWSRFTADRRLLVGCRWVDHSARVALPIAFERAGEFGVPALLRTLPAITNLTELRFAHDQIQQMLRFEVPVEPYSGFLSLAVSLSKLVKHFSLSECCFLTVMTGRFAFGDDRLVDMMRDDLAPQ